MQTENNVPYGYCHCGCGEKTELATRTRAARGEFRGQPRPRVDRHRAPLVPHDMYEVDAETGCWIWRGRIGEGGYGRISEKRSRVRGFGNEGYAHRYMFMVLKGPIPDGLHIDHLCSNRACVNPDHLEAVTQAENNRRMYRRGGRNKDATRAH